VFGPADGPAGFVRVSATPLPIENDQAARIRVYEDNGYQVGRRWQGDRLALHPLGSDPAVAVAFIQLLPIQAFEDHRGLLEDLVEEMEVPELPGWPDPLKIRDILHRHQELSFAFAIGTTASDAQEASG